MFKEINNRYVTKSISDEIQFRSTVIACSVIDGTVSKFRQVRTCF